MDRRTFFPALLGCVAIPRLLQRAPLPSDPVRVAMADGGTDYVAVPYSALVGPEAWSATPAGTITYTVTGASSSGTAGAVVTTTYFN